MKVRLLIIGAGSRGTQYARAAFDALAEVAAVAEPIAIKRQLLGSSWIWSGGQPQAGQEFESWQDFLKYELQRRKDEAAGIPVPPGVHAVFVCVRDEHHVEVLTALAPLGLHIMSEKPLATTLQDCLRIERALKFAPPAIFAIGHVLRYSPHNMLLRHLILEKRVIGDILSIEHTEPVGWWHFSHSYVRGNWRKESKTAPSLLTKSCHDIDFLLWVMCSGPDTSVNPHLPARVSSVGSLKQFRRSQKPIGAGTATNCTKCAISDSCKMSAVKIYDERHLANGDALWPVDIVNPEVPVIYAEYGSDAAQQALLRSLAEDYNAKTTPLGDIEDRSWYGRCVYESDNDVCDDQFVTIEWDDDAQTGVGAKTASFHMIAQSLAQCKRRGRVYGTNGEISYDSDQITLHDFETGKTRQFQPEVPEYSHHGGGDDGLTQQFVKAVAAVMDEGVSVPEAQSRHLGCTMDDIIRSHAAVFLAEEARRTRKVIDWQQWWKENVVEQSRTSSQTT